MGQAAIHIVPSFHYDVVYLQDYESYKLQSFQIIDEALDLLADSTAYRFTIEQVILLEAYWEARPERREALRRFAHEGRLQVAPGLYVMPDMNLPDGESMFLQAQCGIAWLEQHLGLRPDVCWIADCWGHHAQLPQILRQCGYEYYAFWRCMNPELRRNHFHWQGLDGSTLKTHWLSRGYSSILFPTRNEIVNAPDLEMFGCAPQQVQALAADFDRLGAGGVALLCNGGDFMRPQKSAPAALAALQAAGLPISFSHPRQYLEALDWTSAPVYAGEFNSAFQGTFSSNVAIKQGVRRNAFLFHTAERLAALRGKPFPDGERVLKAILKQQFHDTLAGTLADAPRRDTLKELAAIARDLKGWFAGSAKGRQTWLFNPLEFARTEIVRGPRGYVRVRVPGLACAKPAAAEPLGPPVPTALPATFANAFYSARIEADGFLSSLREAEGGTELVNGASPYRFGALTLQLDYGDLWLHFDAPLNGGCPESALTHNDEDPLVRLDAGGLVNRSSFRPAIRTVEVLAATPELLLLRQHGEVSFWTLKVRFTTDVLLRRDSPRIEYHTEIVPAGKHYRLRAAFPTTFGADGEVCHEVPFGVQRRDRATHSAQNWMDFSARDGAAGLALLNRGLPANNVDRAGNLLLTLFRSAAMEYKAPSVGSFGEGLAHGFDYALVPHGRRDFAAIVREGLLFNFPLTRVRGDYAALTVPAWGCTADSVFLSALRQTEGGFFVRLYEGAGRAATAELRLPPGLSAYAPADGLQRPTAAFAPCSGTLKLSFRPFEIRGLLCR